MLINIFRVFPQNGTLHMSGRRVSIDQRTLRERALAAREQFDASGTNISEWARERGFTAKIVLEVLRGDRRCVRGTSHQVAVALGIKDDVPPPGAALGTMEPAR